MGFLFSRRWTLFALAVVAMAVASTLLGQWQFHRLEDRKAENKLVARNLAAPPVPHDELLAVGREPDPQDEWRRVTASGTWDDAHSVVVKYQTRDGASGVEVATPLVTEDGSAVVVDRGWMATDNVGSRRPKLPESTAGKVTVTGWVRLDATGGAARVSDLSTRAVSSTEIAKVVGYPLFGGFLDLDRQSPAPEHALGAVELPDDTSEGPHFFYGLQWWFFGALALFGFGYLAYDERQRSLGSKSA